MTRLLLFCFSLVLPAIAFGQMGPRGFFPWWEMPITKELNLSEDQQRQIRSILRENRTRMIDLRAAWEKAEGEVDDLIDEENVDVKKTNEAIERLIAARTDLTRSFAQMGLKMRTVLTKEQWRELAKRRPQMMMRPGGMGGGGGPRGPRPGGGGGEGARPAPQGQGPGQPD